MMMTEMKSVLKKLMTKPTQDHAQIPCARLGYSLCQTAHKIQPTIGKKNPNRFHQPLFRSSELDSALLPLTGTPHFGQTTALTSIFAPQFWQNLYCVLSFCGVTLL